MKCGTQTALAVGAGYLLGRRRKFKVAAVMAAAAATGGFGGFTGQLLRRGGKLIGSSEALGKLSPDLSEVTDMIRGDLLEVGKAAVLAAARGQLDRVSDKLHDRADAIRLGGERDGNRSDEARDEDSDEPEEDEAGQAEDLDEEPEDEAAGQAEDLDDEPEDEEPEDEEPAPRRRRSSSTRGTRTRSPAGAPVRRTRR